MFFGKKTKVEYLEKPVTPEEMEVAELLEKVLAAMNQGNISEALSSYTDTARIVPAFSKYEEPHTKDTYEKHLRRWPPTGRFLLRDVLIRIAEGKKEASVTASLYASFANEENKLWQITKRYFRLVKTAKEWRITEATNA